MGILTPIIIFQPTTVISTSILINCFKIQQVLLYVVFYLSLILSLISTFQSMDPLLEYLDNRVSQLHDLLDDSIFPDMLDELWAILVMHCADLIIDGVSQTGECTST